LVRTEGEVDANSREALKETLVEQGYFLSCQQKPYEGMDVKSADANSLFIKAKVTSVESRMGHMFQIFIEPLDDFSFKPGQFLNVKNAAGTIRSYSIASTDQSKGALLEIHVRQHEHGEVSSWLCDTNRVGEEIEISGANGSCFYVSGRTEQPMLLIGTGTGLAPLLGIIRESLSHGHTGPIELYHGAVNNGGLYFTDELNKLADKHQNLKVFYGALEKGNEGDEVFEGLIQNHALTNNPDLKGWRVFLCGDPGMVMATKTKAYLADAMLSDIFSDPFDIKKVEF
jgi:CDP-4-dehydro-6-deoxyglucose reductase, E3